MTQGWIGEPVDDEKPDIDLTEDAAAIVHDLRIPLSVVSGYGAMLAGGELGELSPSAQAAVSSVIAKTEEMRILLDGLLELSRTQTAMGAASHVHSSNLVDSARSACDRAGHRAQLRGDRVDLHVESDSVPVRADPRLLDRILDNLLHNALTHAPHPARVLVRVRHRHGRGEVTVEDNGPGVDGSVIPSLFVGRIGPTSPTSGAGLGLRLCSALAGRLGGTLELGSGEEGAVFVLALPLGS